MSNASDCVWNPNAIDKSCLPMTDIKSCTKKKKNCSSHYYWIALIVILVLILVVILNVIFAVRTKSNLEPSVINPSNTSSINQQHNLSIKGLLTVDTAAKADICDQNEKIEDCVLVYNAKIIMSALVLVPSSNKPPISSTFPENSIKDTINCKALYIRRNQLPQIFEPSTLKTIYKISGIPYSPAEGLASSYSVDQAELRSQIDARSIQNRWTSPINYYINVTSGLNPAMVASIRTAISNWDNNTCLKFNELSVITSTINKTYVSFRRDDDYGCSSPVGYDPTDPTSVILISSYCSAIIASIMHEIGHTLGYIHTQSRIDRDDYVTLATANIEQDYAANFFKWGFGTIRFLDTNFPYDFGSFMHYDSYGFSKNGEATIIPLDTRYARTLGQREKASFYDYKTINRLYFNRAECPQMFSNNGCQNNGYLDPKTCSRCVCPEGFSGTYCDQRDSTSNCGETITNPTPYSSTRITIENPMPTSTTSTLQYCVYHIRSSSAGKIRFQLDSINTIARYVCSLTSVIEVKYQSDLAVTGARWCGLTVPTVWLNVTAESNTMVIIFRANNYINATTKNSQAGFRATIIFDAEPIPAGNQSVTTATTTTTTATTTTRTMSTTTTTTTVSKTISTTTTTNILTTTTTPLSTCPPSSFRCQLSSQPTCGGCLSYQPCSSQGTQQCIAYNYQVQLTGCDNIINGVAQCRYQFLLTPYTTNCQRTILICCPNYQLVSYGTQYFCVYNPQAVNPSQWSLVT